MKVFVICRDRLDPLQQLLPWISHLEVVLVDNASTYEPLLDFYSTTSHEVVYAGANLKHHAPWHLGLIPKNERYIVTDPDVIPDPDIPHDWLEVMEDVLDLNPLYQKVGLSLRIDNLPDHYALREAVVKWESKWWFPKAKVGKYSGFKAPIDTTFAMYRENVPLIRDPCDMMPAFRLAPPYSALHLPWYADSENPTEEEIYYKEHADLSVSHWLHDEVTGDHIDPDSL